MKKPGSMGKEPGGDGVRNIPFFTSEKVSKEDDFLNALALTTPERDREDDALAKRRREVVSAKKAFCHLAEGGYPAIFPAYLRVFFEKVA
jgi:hypothetical protein